MTEKIFKAVMMLDTVVKTTDLTLYKFNTPVEYKHYPLAKSFDVVEECRDIKSAIEDITLYQPNLSYSYIEVRSKK